MRSTFLRLALLFACALSLEANDQTVSKNIETLELTSKVFNNTRTIRILLPPGYHDPVNHSRKYPVFYFNDGLMVFDDKEYGIRIEDIFYDLYNLNKIPFYLIVGIDNGACTDKTKNEIRDRANEFLPYPDAGFSPDHTYEPDPPTPQGNLYPKFLLEEVIPTINRKYRTKTEPENTGIGGFSYGGVSALYTVVTHPQIFGMLLLESSPLYVGHKQELMRDAENTKSWPLAIYIGSGTKESDDEAFNQRGLILQERISNIIKSHSPNSRMKLFREKGSTHSTEAWRKRLPAALTFLLSTGS